MSRSKVLYQISGSIAAYKSAGIISKLVQSGYEVQTVATNSALKFIGEATLEGLTGKPVLTDMFAPGQLMDHINLVKWADLVILAPATANTLNRLAQGLADDLIGALFLAHDWKKPYLIAPAMNTKMYQHPATQNSIKTLKTWGVNMLATSEGYLACGDEGQGKMLEPERILNAIYDATPIPDKKLKLLISSGGTRESIDDVRYVSNISTGQTGSILADTFIRGGHAVTFLHGVMSKTPDLVCECIPYTSSQNLDNLLKEQLSSQHFDVVIHLAAVSDFLPIKMDTDGGSVDLPFVGKLSSGSEKPSLHFRRNSKLVENIKSYSQNKELQLVAFKLTSGSNQARQIDSVEKLFKNVTCDFVVANDMDDRTNDTQTSFHLFERTDSAHVSPVTSSSELALLLLDKLTQNKENSL